MNPIEVDNPINSPSEDALGRDPSARRFAFNVLSLDSSRGAVVGVLGRWGTGKTSFINLARREISSRGVPILEFNPWMFSGAEQLVSSFFSELSEQLKLKPELSALGDKIEDYGEAFSTLGLVPIVGSWATALYSIAKAASFVLRKRQRNLNQKRKAIEAALSALEKPIVVIIDDIDRLGSAEIRDVFKLVRLTASFPNIIYVVSFDRRRVEGALKERGIEGRDYLEKILQVSIDLPSVPDAALNSQLLEALTAVISSVEKPGPFDETRWPDIFIDIIRPLVRNMRDVRRYVTVVSWTIRDMAGQISVVDLLALEAIRIFAPDVFSKIQSSVAALTSVSARIGGHGDNEDKRRIVDLIASAKDRKDEAESLIERIFPAAQHHISNIHYSFDSQKRWKKDRRVAIDDFLNLYLERVSGEGLNAFLAAQVLWNKFGNPVEFEEELRRLAPEALEDAVAQLETYEDEFPNVDVGPIIASLLNIIPDIPEKQRGMLDFGSDVSVGRVVYRLLKAVDDPVKVESVAEQIWDRLKLLGGKLKLVTIVGHHPNAGHKLVSLESAEKLEKKWLGEVKSASVDALAKEKGLLHILLVAKSFSKSESGGILAPDDPFVTLALLRDALTETLSQSAGSRAVKRSPRLAWDNLIEVVGGLENLKVRLAAAEKVSGTSLTTAFDLAKEYLNGKKVDDRPF